MTQLPNHLMTVFIELCDPRCDYLAASADILRFKDRPNKPEQWDTQKYDL
jgi:hypothetical protein